MNALIVVDVQNDFLPGGALPVPDGQAIIPLINVLQPCFDLVVATQDWHPPDHVSFADSHPGTHAGEEIELDGRRQNLWPVHCIADSPGAALAGGLEVSRIERVLRKGVDRHVDSYSGFFDDGRASTGLGDFLRQRGVTDVYVCGLALEYCVQATAIDACREGWKAHVILDATRAIDAAPGDMARAIETLQAAGIELLTSNEVRRRLACGDQMTPTASASEGDDYSANRLR